MGNRTHPTSGARLAGAVDDLLLIMDTNFPVEHLSAADRRRVADARDIADRAREGGAR